MSDVTRAIAAATSVAASLGLLADDAIVLHNSNKLALRLTPCDVFARVARVGQEVAQFEVELAQRLAEVGSPVRLLEPRVEPRVYTRDGFAVTLWTYYEPATPHVSPAGYARALERLHAGMRKVDVPSPCFMDRITEAEEAVANPDRSPELADADRVLLSARRGSLRNPNLDQELLDECRQLVLAMLAAWRWELGDQFPNGRRFGEEFLRLLREGPPSPTFDAVIRRLGGL